jgi:hypothetical protein
MDDKSLDIFLSVLFGIGGLAILILMWLQPMPLFERILSISIGSIGVVWLLIRILLWNPQRAGAIESTPDSVK